MSTSGAEKQQLAMSSVAVPMSRAAKKNAKRRAAKRRQADPSEDGVNAGHVATDSSHQPTVSAPSNTATPATSLVNGNGKLPDSNQGGSLDAADMRSKQKQLQRKLKDISKLEEARSQNVILEDSQVAKLKSKASLMQELAELNEKLGKLPAVDPVTLVGSSTPSVLSNTSPSLLMETLVNSANQTNVLAQAPAAAAAAAAALLAGAINPAGFSGFPPPPIGNPLLPLPGNLPYFFPNPMMPPPMQAPDMFGFMPPPMPPFANGAVAPMAMPDSNGLPTQALGTNDTRSPSLPASNGVPTMQGSAGSVSPGTVPTSTTSQQQQHQQPPQQLLPQHLSLSSFPPLVSPQQQPQQPQPPQQQQLPVQRSRPVTRVIIRDPNTGNDVTEKILGKRSVSGGASSPDTAVVAAESFASNGTGSSFNASATSPGAISGTLAEQVALLGLSGSSTPSTPSSPLGSVPSAMNEDAWSKQGGVSSSSFPALSGNSSSSGGNAADNQMRSLSGQMVA